MGVKEIIEFVKVEHTLFSLPFVLIGYVLAHAEFGSGSLDLLWIPLAAVAARGLAMVLNRIIDSDIDAENPCLLYTSPSPRDQRGSRMPSSA